MNILKKFLAKNRSKRIKVHVLGDAIIDLYHSVKVNRICPEHPCPVMLSTTDAPIQKPGGVGNVAYQFHYLNADVKLFSFCDQKAKQVFLKHDIQHEFFMAAALPVKKRFLDNGIQIIRHDVEIPLCGLELSKIDWITEKIKDKIEAEQLPDVAIFSDYNKGFFASSKFNLLNCYRGITTIVDPKIGPVDKWKGCTIFKPNAKEAAELTGKTDWKDQARQLQDMLGCHAVVITFGGEKVAGAWNGDLFTYRPNKKVMVESVVGAGDCFCAFFALAIGHGFTVPEAVEIAWNAGSIYVQGRMNRPLIPAELSYDKIVEPEDLKSRNFKLTLVNGVFDFGLTSAHVKCLEEAKSMGDKLVVAVNSDESVYRLKGDSRPIMSLKERMQVLAGLGCVDFVTYFEEDTPLELIKKVIPDILAKGGDYKIEDVVGYGIVPVALTDKFDSISTTQKIEKCPK